MPGGSSVEDPGAVVKGADAAGGFFDLVGPFSQEVLREFCEAGGDIRSGFI